MKAKEVQQRQFENKQKETEEKLAEIATTCSNDILTEKTSNDKPNDGCRRHRHFVLFDRWKGMEKNEIDEIRQTQLKQIQERRVN